MSAVSTTVRTVLAVWLALMASTAASTWWLSSDSFAPEVSDVAVLLIAAGKVSLVMAFFMELRRAPRAWQAAGTLWLITATSTVMGIYLR